MGISSSMNAGVSGLNANANKLATISDNIANSQTYGYKRRDIDFASMTIDENVRSYTAGGVRTTVDPRRRGQGRVRRHRRTPPTSPSPGAACCRSPTIASVVAGETNLPLMLTSTGSFEPDAQRRLRTPVRAWCCSAGRPT